jgi:hypothetical protein
MESYSGVVRERKPSSDSRVLDLIVQRQELTHWCWAAISASLGRYYGTRSWQQYEVASVLLGVDCSRFQEDPTVVERCDTEVLLSEALQLMGCYSHWSPGRPTIERIQTEIDADRAVCVHIDWYRGGSHYVVVNGYDSDSGELYISDPLHGPSIQIFDVFPHRYRVSQGVWRGTFWTNPGPRTPRCT